MGVYLVLATDFRKNKALEEPASYGFEFGVESQANLSSMLLKTFIYLFLVESDN